MDGGRTSNLSALPTVPPCRTVCAAYILTVDAVDTETTSASHLLIAALSSSLLIVVLLLCTLYLIHRRGCRETPVKRSLTAVITLTPSPLLDVSSDLREISFGYSGSGSGVLYFYGRPA